MCTPSPGPNLENLRAPSRVLAAAFLLFSCPGLHHSARAIDDSDIAPLPPVSVFQYQASPRDPFVDASVKRTVRAPGSEGLERAQGPNWTAFSGDFEKLAAEFYKITGVVSGGASGGVALIGRRIVRTGDSLDLFLGDELLRKIRKAQSGKRAESDSQLEGGVVRARIERISESGIRFSLPQIQSPLELPFRKAASATPTDAAASELPPRQARENSR